MATISIRRADLTARLHRRCAIVGGHRRRINSGQVFCVQLVRGVRARHLSSAIDDIAYSDGHDHAPMATRWRWWSSLTGQQRDDGGVSVGGMLARSVLSVGGSMSVDIPTAPCDVDEKQVQSSLITITMYLVSRV